MKKAKNNLAILVVVSGGKSKPLMLVSKPMSKYWLIENVTGSPNPRPTLQNRDLFFNWVAFMETHQLTKNIVFMCINAAAQGIVYDAGYSCDLHFNIKAVSPDVEEQVAAPAIWLQRARIVSHLVKVQGLNVIVTDLDAVWVKNPLPHLDVLQGDILALRDIGAAAACQGCNKGNFGRHVVSHKFVLFRASAAPMMDDLYTQEVAAVAYDQMGLNNLLSNTTSGCSWNSLDDGMSTAVCTNILVGRGAGAGATADATAGATATAATSAASTSSAHFVHPTTSSLVVVILPSTLRFLVHNKGEVMRSKLRKHTRKGASWKGRGDVGHTSRRKYKHHRVHSKQQALHEKRASGAKHTFAFRAGAIGLAAQHRGGLKGQGRHRHKPLGQRERHAHQQELEQDQVEQHQHHWREKQQRHEKHKQADKHHRAQHATKDRLKDRLTRHIARLRKTKHTDHTETSGDSTGGLHTHKEAAGIYDA
jgi:hypothetical protein